MEKYKYLGFDKLEEDSALFLSLPLCDMLHSFMGDRDFSYISAALYPLELTELILHYLEYSKGIEQAKFKAFAEKYYTEDSLCPIESLLDIWGREKFDNMISELKILAKE